MSKSKGAALAAPPEEFYADALRCLAASGVPFMVAGAYAMREYADIWRDTKDLDVFCTAGQYPLLLSALADAGYGTEITDANWLAKAFCGDRYVDIIFGSANRMAPIDSSWFEHAHECELFGCTVLLAPPEEIIWSKALVQSRERYDGADVAHMLRKQGPSLDWQRLINRMEPLWEVLLSQLLLFRFVYPSERDTVPRWVMEELNGRVRAQLDVPTPKERLCRGRLLSRSQYEIDYEEWGYHET